MGPGSEAEAVESGHPSAALAGAPRTKEAETLAPGLTAGSSPTGVLVPQWGEQGRSEGSPEACLGDRETGSEDREDAPISRPSS